MPDMGASILARLKNSAREKGISYQQCLQLFFQEEFLRKLAMSKYVDSLVLKGGLFIYTLTDFQSRATIDVDFLLRQHSNSIEEVEKMVQEILDIRTGNYFITMTANGFEKISPQRKYNGISTQIIGKIKNVRVPFNVDIGVGDVIVPKAEHRQIHTQLEDFDTPTIVTYSLESTIAEKLDAILQRYELTGRMKDFYDIYYLSKTFDFDGQKLQTAIYETLQNRGTPYEKDSFTRVTELKNDPGMKTKWRYFLRTMKNESLPFADVVDTIADFLQPVFYSLLAEEEWQKSWDCEAREWESEGPRLVPV
jgi:predicted nucleotidyltransferase component of viral defense system